MTNPINPIPTTYAGCAFRSRLEARWAVLFDALGIDWLYEPQGFNVAEREGRRHAYLPDFYLPANRLWVEVKGTDDAMDVDKLIAATAPSDEGGLPLDPEGTVDTHDRRNGPRMLIPGPIPRTPSQHGVVWFHKGDWGLGWGRFAPGAFAHDTAHFDEAGTFYRDSGERYTPSHGFTEARPIPHPYPALVAAYDAARRARFEHGERGWP